MNKKLYEIDELLKIIPMSRAGIYLAIKKATCPLCAWDVGFSCLPGMWTNW